MLSTWYSDITFRWHTCNQGPVITYCQRRRLISPSSLKTVWSTVSPTLPTPKRAIKMAQGPLLLAVNWQSIFYSHLLILCWRRLIPSPPPPPIKPIIFPNKSSTPPSEKKQAIENGWPLTYSFYKVFTYH